MSGGQWPRLVAPVLDLLFPPRCETCAQLGRPPLCAECQAQIVFGLPPYCRLCGTLLPATAAPGLCGDCRQERRYYDAARSVGVHCGPLRRAILQYKFNNRRALAGPLAELLATRLREEPTFPSPLPVSRLDCLVPIPLHVSRRRWRGFDQALQLCQRLSPLLGLPLEARALVRVRATRPQVQLSPRERHQNMRGAFAVQGDRLRGRRVLLVDDVYTTGATANCAAQACRLGGAAEVYVLTLSRPAPAWHPAALVLAPDEEEQRAGN
mgnify:CR=1 FL=1